MYGASATIATMYREAAGISIISRTDVEDRDRRIDECLRDCSTESRRNGCQLFNGQGGVRPTCWLCS